MSAPKSSKSCLEIVDNILREDKLPIVQLAASQFYVFTSPSIPTSLAKSEGLLSARKIQADEPLWSIITLKNVDRDQ